MEITSEKTVYERLIDHFHGVTAAADALKTTPNVVSNWKKRGIPSDWALPIEEATRRRIPARDVLRERAA